MQEQNAPPRDELVAAAVQYTLLATAVVRAGVAPQVVDTLEEMEGVFDADHLLEVQSHLVTVAGAMPGHLDWGPVFDEIERRRKERSQP